MPPQEDIVWDADSSLPMRLLLGGHLYPHELGVSAGTDFASAETICGEGWLPKQVNCVAKLAVKSVDKAPRLQLALQCHADRLVMQQHCRLWLRCVHDVRSKSNTAAMTHRRAKFMIPSNDASVPSALRQRILRGCEQRFAHLQDRVRRIDTIAVDRVTQASTLNGSDRMDEDGFVPEVSA